MKVLPLSYLTVYTITILVVAQRIVLTSATIGICFGPNGDNLPSPSEVVNLYKKENIPLIRLYEPNPAILDALRGSGIKVAIDNREDLQALATDPNVAKQWVQQYIVDYKDDVDFGWLIVGNEVIPGSTDVPDALVNVWDALNSFGIEDIKVSTAAHGVMLGSPVPPSTAYFNDNVKCIMGTILEWLIKTNNPLFVNIHPYWSMVQYPDQYPFDLALFRPAHPFQDGNLTYNSVLEVTIDGFYTAMEKMNATSVGLVVMESGWPTEGNGPYTSVENARVYNQNLINLMKAKGSPKRPNDKLDTFIFAMFNENLKPQGVEQHWGIHKADMTPLYQLSF